MRKSAFGGLFKRLRSARGMTLRQFCETHGFDPGNLSKLERGLLPPPESEAKLQQYAKALGLRRGRDEWFEFFDLARAARGRIPPEIRRNREVVERLPLLFRTLRGQRVSREKLNQLIEMVRRS